MRLRVSIEQPNISVSEITLQFVRGQVSHQHDRMSVILEQEELEPVAHRARPGYPGSGRELTKRRRANAYCGADHHACRPLAQMVIASAQGFCHCSPKLPACHSTTHALDQILHRFRRTRYNIQLPSVAGTSANIEKTSLSGGASRVNAM
jgi:hypothetical protein